MAVRAIFLPICHRRTARGLPNRIQTMFGRAVFYSTISIDDINAQRGWSLKTEKIRLKWHVRGEIQMIPESAYKSSASKNWEILWKNKL